MAKQIVWALDLEGSQFTGGIVPPPTWLAVGISWLQNAGLSVPVETIDADAKIAGSNVVVSILIGKLSLPVATIAEPPALTGIVALLEEFGGGKVPEISASATLEDVPVVAPPVAAAPAA